MMVTNCEKKETNESWISRCKLSAQKHGVFAKEQSWKNDSKAAKTQIRGERTHVRRAVARKEAQGKKKAKQCMLDLW